MVKYNDSQRKLVRVPQSDVHFVGRVNIPRLERIKPSSLDFEYTTEGAVVSILKRKGLNPQYYPHRGDFADLSYTLKGKVRNGEVKFFSTNDFDRSRALRLWTSSGQLNAVLGRGERSRGKAKAPGVYFILFRSGKCYQVHGKAVQDAWLG
jgi:hypothetical protein